MESTKLIFFLLALFFLPGLNLAQGQESDSLTFNVKSEFQVKGRKTVYNLVVEITRTNGSAYHSVYIYDKEPWKGGKIIKKEEKTSLQNLTFTNVAPLKYCVLVIDDKQNMKGSWFQVEPVDNKDN